MNGYHIVDGLVLSDGAFAPGEVVTDGDTIRAPGSARPRPVTTIDASGLLVAPGFVDLQINGGYGHDIASEPRSLWDLGIELPRHGVTSFLPTIISSPPNTTAAAMAAIGDRPDGYRGAEPIGLHFEGPMLNGERRGAHPAAHLVEPALDIISTWSAANGVRLVTVAPELPGATEVIRQLVDRGVVVAAGHTEATAEETEAGMEAGVAMVTHLFNAMAPLGHRDPNLVGVALADRRLTVGLIADGLHVDPIVVTATLRAKGPGGIALVTDAVAPMGLGPGRYELAATTITADTESVRTDAGVLAGSILTMDQAVRNMMAFTGCDPAEAVGMATTTPATAIGEDGRGRIAPGAVADLVLLDDDLTVQLTICAGRLAHVDPAAEWRVAGLDREDPSWRS